MSARRMAGGNSRRTVQRHAAAPPADRRLTNQLLGLLDEPSLARLQPHLEPVHLERGEILFSAHEPLRAAHFPDTAVISFVSRLESGEVLEVGLVGRDGLAGTAVFPGITSMSCDGFVQVAGLARRVSADILRREVLASQSLSSTIGRYSQTLLSRSMQMSICNMFHPIEQRCIRWLLTVRDLIGQNDIPLTHDLLATMLGVHRPTVTLVIRSLHRAGLVAEARGRITILDRGRLLDACCECYRVMAEEQLGLLGY